jgi:histidine triad (HIT) family protein
MATIFTKIIQGEIPCHKIAENENYFAFLDIHPIKPGHTLVIPKKEVDYIFDINDEALSGLMIFAKKIALAIQKSVTCTRIGIMVAGLEVPHCHIQLVPFNNAGDLNFANAKSASNEELLKTAEEIRKNITLD